MRNLELIGILVFAGRAAVGFLDDALVESNLGGIGRKGIDDDLAGTIVVGRRTLRLLRDRGARAPRQHKYTEQVCSTELEYSHQVTLHSPRCLESAEPRAVWQSRNEDVDAEAVMLPRPTLGERRQMVVSTDI